MRTYEMLTAHTVCEGHCHFIEVRKLVDSSHDPLVAHVSYQQSMTYWMTTQTQQVNLLQ